MGFDEGENVEGSTVGLLLVGRAVGAVGFNVGLLLGEYTGDLVGVTVG